MTDFIQVVENAVLGVAAGTGYALTGYVSNYRQGKHKVFSASEFGKTVLVGAVAGGALGFTNVSFGEDVIANFVILLSTFGFVGVLKKIGRIVFPKL